MAAARAVRRDPARRLHAGDGRLRDRRPHQDARAHAVDPDHLPDGRDDRAPPRRAGLLDGRRRLPPEALRPGDAAVEGARVPGAAPQERAARGTDPPPEGPARRAVAEPAGAGRGAADRPAGQLGARRRDPGHAVVGADARPVPDRARRPAAHRGRGARLPAVGPPRRRRPLHRPLDHRRRRRRAPDLPRQRRVRAGARRPGGARRRHAPGRHRLRGVASARSSRRPRPCSGSTTS